jgi:hypothetical protein
VVPLSARQSDHAGLFGASVVEMSSLGGSTSRGGVSVGTAAAAAAAAAGRGEYTKPGSSLGGPGRVTEVSASGALSVFTLLERSQAALAGSHRSASDVVNSVEGDGAGGRPVDGGGTRQKLYEPSLLPSNDSPFAARGAPPYRIMMHVGPLVGAVIGRGSVSYDYYGHAVAEACAVLDIADGLGAGVSSVLASVKFANLCRLIALCDESIWRRQVDHLLSIRRRSSSSAAAPTRAGVAAPCLTVASDYTTFLHLHASASTTMHELVGSNTGTIVTTTAAPPSSASVGGTNAASFGGSLVNEPNAKEGAGTTRIAPRRYLPRPRRVGAIPAISASTLDDFIVGDDSDDVAQNKSLNDRHASLLRLGADKHLQYMVGPQLHHLLPTRFRVPESGAVNASHVTSARKVTKSIPSASAAMESSVDTVLSAFCASFGEYAMRWCVGGQEAPVDVLCVKYIHEEREKE